MDSNRKWTTMVAIGIGVGSLLITGRSLARFVGKWRLSRQSEAFHNALVERLKDPLPSTTIVTRNVEWERVYIELTKYSNIFTSFINRLDSDLIVFQGLCCCPDTWL